MCIHHRLIYRSCGHFTWLGTTKKCNTERGFEQGKTEEGCNLMWTHPLSTYRVDRCCDSCAVKREKTDRAIVEIRERIQVTRGLLAKIQGGSRARGLEQSECSSVKKAEMNVFEHSKGSDNEADASEVKEAETMDLIDPTDMIKFVGGIGVGLQSLDSPTPSKRHFGKKLRIQIPIRTSSHLLTMPWGLWASPTTNSGRDEGKTSPSANSSSTTPPTTASANACSNHGANSNMPPLYHATPERSAPTYSDSRLTDLPPIPRELKKKAISWNDSLWSLIDWQHYQEPRNIVFYTLPTIGAFAVFSIWRKFLRRFRGAAYISPGFFRRRTLLGKVTSVGDGDNFHFFHTPGGRLAGWGWLRKVPTGRKDLKDRTIPIRIAGIDAPECAHFGRPAQPYSTEALQWLRGYILGKRVRARIYRKDQYDRVVATVFVRKPPFFLRKDVGLEMLKAGLATMYEAKTGAEFGGPKMEQLYKNTEAVARRKGKGMWANELTGFFGLGRRREIESPRQYKDRMRAAGNPILEKKPAAAAKSKATTVAKKTTAVKKEPAPAKKATAAATAATSSTAKKV
ncbi:hypothetical protein B0T20DRAFT_359247 [Sordaria brevicollis]|uniref:Probable endonuclease LCL3 n=1 Tax=Sordaria brevicollis TaxID=83679 RepID=A0AAE0P987_SORBR|nr:hypothetical protein B0T20DRAFT_359247 [Sordaria brevicollis]